MVESSHRRSLVIPMMTEQHRALSFENVAVLLLLTVAVVLSIWAMNRVGTLAERTASLEVSRDSPHCMCLAELADRTTEDLRLQQQIDRKHP